MAELSNMIWLGGVVAELGPVGFQQLWAHLHKVLVHYIYGLEVATCEACDAAHQSLRDYAELLEQKVYEGQVPSYMLKPNLHTALCNLREQEELWGPTALYAEWYMERYV